MYKRQVYLNASVSERIAIVDIVNLGLESAGGYIPPTAGAKPWHAAEVEAYFNYLLGA